VTPAPHSIVRNEQRRCFLSSLGWLTTESAAVSDILHRRKLIHADEHRGAKEILDRIAIMLVELAGRREQA
jgi:hypothetical protein